MYQAVIIDDEPHIVEGLKTAIDWSGFQLEIGCAATDSAAALDYILNNPVNVVITDVSMPGIDGLQLIQRVKEAKPSIYIIVLSAFDNFEYARTALRCGAENYLLKPLDPDELSDTISQIIGHLQERDQLNSTYGRAMLTFRNAFTEQWVKNLLTNHELSTKAELLGINLNAPRFTAIIFSCPNGQETVMSRFFDLFLQYLPGHYTGNFFFETPCRLVGVLSPAGMSENISCFLQTIMQAAAGEHLCIFAAAGSTVAHYMDVHLSYQQADAFSFLQHTPCPCFFYQHIPGLTEAAAHALDGYERSCQKDKPPLEALYEQFDALSCTLYLLSHRIGRLCKKGYELPKKYPDLTEALSALPDGSRPSKEHLTYVLQFLKSSDKLLEKVNQSMYPCVDAVIKAVAEFSDKDISLKTLAARLNVSPSYLGTVFHQQTGCYFNDYLTEARLNYAAELLEQTDLKIKDIVEKIGFASQTYFNRALKRCFDTSPLNYRREKKTMDFQK